MLAARAVQLWGPLVSVTDWFAERHRNYAVMIGQIHQLMIQILRCSIRLRKCSDPCSAQAATRAKARPSRFIPLDVPAYALSADAERLPVCAARSMLAACSSAGDVISLVRNYLLRLRLAPRGDGVSWLELLCDFELQTQCDLTSLLARPKPAPHAPRL
eukprot:15163929-Alexandrium_andersonii.AAC.1